MKFDANQIKSYINQNFENPDLNVNSIAMEFGISLSYMSRRFKTQEGIGMADYISLCRISRAKEYLVNTNHSVGKILTLVGFDSANVFVRAFKRFVGTTPKQYRILG